MSVELNKIVAIEYELKDPVSGELLDSNVGGKPLEFMVGKGNIIYGLEKEIVKMNIGDNATILVKAEEAYGTYNEEAVEVVPLEQFSGINLYKGMSLFGKTEDGGTIEVIVKDINEDTALIDYNHPLAGKDLSFNVNILSSRDATREEMLMGSACCDDGGGCCGGGCAC